MLRSIVVNYYVRLKASKEAFKFIIKYWYEIPAMLPLLLYAAFDTPTIVGAAIRGLRDLLYSLDC